MRSPFDSGRSAWITTHGPGRNRRDALMLEYLKTIRQLKSDKSAVTALEYGLIAAVIIVVCAGAFATVGTDLHNTLNTVTNCFSGTC
jgi:pilus assembly protein Flp/PilA